jgi:hypothetical protein
MRFLLTNLLQDFRVSYFDNDVLRLSALALELTSSFDPASVKQIP